MSCIWVVWDSASPSARSWICGVNPTAIPTPSDRFASGFFFLRLYFLSYYDITPTPATFYDSRCMTTWLSRFACLKLEYIPLARKFRLNNTSGGKVPYMLVVLLTVNRWLGRSRRSVDKVQSLLACADLLPS